MLFPPLYLFSWIKSNSCAYAFVEILPEGSIPDTKTRARYRLRRPWEGFFGIFDSDPTEAGSYFPSLADIQNEITRLRKSGKVVLTDRLPPGFKQTHNCTIFREGKKYHAALKIEPLASFLANVCKKTH